MEKISRDINQEVFLNRMKWLIFIVTLLFGDNSNVNKVASFFKSTQPAKIQEFEMPVLGTDENGNLPNTPPDFYFFDINSLEFQNLNDNQKRLYIRQQENQGTLKQMLIDMLNKCYLDRIFTNTKDDPSKKFGVRFKEISKYMNDPDKKLYEALIEFINKSTYSLLLLEEPEIFANKYFTTEILELLINRYPEGSAKAYDILSKKLGEDLVRPLLYDRYLKLNNLKEA